MERVYMNTVIKRLGIKMKTDIKVSPIITCMRE